MQFFNNIKEIIKKYNILPCMLNDVSDELKEQYHIDIINIFNYGLSIKHDSNTLNIIGLYYEYVKKDYNSMKRYYLRAIKLKNDVAMYNLGDYYQTIEYNYIKMLKYYLQAIELGNTQSMNDLGFYYCNIKDYDAMEQCYLQAAQLGNSNAMYNLGHYYQYVKINYGKMKQYYSQIMELMYDGDVMYNLGNYYGTIEIDYNKMKYYYLQSMEFIDENNNDISDKIKNRMVIIIENLKECFDPIVLYSDFTSIINKNKFINNAIFELLNLPEVNVYVNKINYSTQNNIIHSCSVCLENDKLNISFNCMHFICVECYCKVKKCPYCNCIK